MKTILTLLLTLSSTCLIAQVDSTLIRSWRSYSVPSSKDTLIKYSHAPTWRVFIKDGEVKIVKGSYRLNLPFRIQVTNETREKFSGTPHAFKVVDGYLVSFDRGEFGGSLYWFSEDGTDNYEIPGPPLIQVINRNGKIFGFEGLAHSSLTDGSIVELLKINDRWTIKPYLKLPGAPHAVQLDDHGNFIIVTSPDLISVDGNRNIKTLISKGIWYPYLYPSTLVVREGAVYIGMRQGVYRYNLKTKKSDWLMSH